MAPMITDSYTKYNSSDFGKKNQSANFFNPAASATSTVKPFGVMSQNQSFSTSSSYDLGGGGSGSATSKRLNSEDEETLLEIFKGSNPRLQIEKLDEFMEQCQTGGVDILLKLVRVNDLLELLGYLMLNTANGDVQRTVLKFLQAFFKASEKLRLRRKTDKTLNEHFRRTDAAISDTLLPFLLEASVSSKLLLKQMSIDIIYSYMKLTDSVSAMCLAKFIKWGIENSSDATAKAFVDTTLSILITDELVAVDYSTIVQALCRKISENARFEHVCAKCLNKIETVVKAEQMTIYINKMPPNLQLVYRGLRRSSKGNAIDLVSLKSGVSSAEITSSAATSLKFNFIAESVAQNLSGENELTRLQAINQLDASVKMIIDIKKVYPHYQDFIEFMNQFVDDTNYEIRVSALKILCTFIQKLGPNVNLSIDHQYCYKAICSCARNVASQTHQSKTIKQCLSSMVLITCEHMVTPIFVLESLLEKVKDKPAKAREEILNVIIASVLKFPGDKFESLRKVFYHVVPLMCDIKRNVRHAALECIAVLYPRIRDNVSNQSVIYILAILFYRKKTDNTQNKN